MVSSNNFQGSDYASSAKPAGNSPRVESSAKFGTSNHSLTEDTYSPSQPSEPKEKKTHGWLYTLAGSVFLVAAGLLLKKHITGNFFKSFEKKMKSLKNKTPLSTSGVSRATDVSLSKADIERISADMSKSHQKATERMGMGGYDIDSLKKTQAYFKKFYELEYKYAINNSRLTSTSMTLSGKDYARNDIKQVVEKLINPQKHPGILSPAKEAAHNEITHHYQEAAKNSLCKEFQDEKGTYSVICKGTRSDLLNGKLKAADVDTILTSREQSARQIVLRNTLVKIAYKRAKAKKPSDLTVAEKDVIKQFEDRSTGISQTLHQRPITGAAKNYYEKLSKKSQETLTTEEKAFMKGFETRQAEKGNSLTKSSIGYDQKISDGFKLTCGTDLLRDNDTTVIHLKTDAILKDNIQAIKNKLAKTPKISELKKWELIQQHVNETFNVKAKDAEEIFRNLPYGTQNDLGTHITHGIGICRHKALLTKLIGDEMNLKSAMLGGVMANSSGAGGHAWNTVLIKNKEYLFDAHNDYLEPLTEELKKKFVVGMGVAEYEKLQAQIASNV